MLDDLTLVVYPGEPGALTLYDDDGESQDYRTGQRALTEIRSSFDDGVVRVDVSAVTGEYAGQPAARDLTFRIWSAERPSSVSVRRDGMVVQVSADAYGPTAGAAASWQFTSSNWAVVRLSQVRQDEAVSIEIGG